MFLSQISRRSCSPASSIPACMGLSDLWHLGQGIWQFQLPSVLHYSSQSYTEKFFWTMSMKQDSIFVSAFKKFNRSSPLPVSWILLLLNTYVFNMGPIIHWLIFGQYIDLQSKKDLEGLKELWNITESGLKTSGSISCFTSGKVGQVITTSQCSAVHFYKAEMQTSIHKNTTNYYSNGCSCKIG